MAALLSLMAVCACSNDADLATDIYLAHLDSLVDNNSNCSSILDTLSPDLCTSLKTKKQSAYYNLIYSAALLKSNRKIGSNAAILSSYQFYKEEQNQKPDSTSISNYAKSCVILAITKYYKNHKDSLVYPLLKEAQTIFERLGEHNHYLAQVYINLGYFTNFAGNRSSIRYYNKALKELFLLNDTILATNLKIKIATSYTISGQNIDVADSLILSIKENHLTSHKLRYNYYNLRATHSAIKEDYGSAAKFAGLRNSVPLESKPKGMDLAHAAFTISKYHSLLRQADSALHYAKIALRSVVESRPKYPRMHIYIKNLGDAYYNMGEYELASNVYNRAFEKSVEHSITIYRNLASTIENNYRQIQVIDNIRQQKADLKITTLYILTILLLALLCIGLLLYKTRIDKKIKENIALQHKALEKDLKQSKTLMDVVSISFGILPKFIDKVNDISSKIFSSDPHLYDSFQDEIGTIKAEMRKRLLELVNQKSFAENYPILEHLDSLSNQEKMITLLLDQKYNTKYIAGILNVSQSSVRASKVKIKSKITEADMPDQIKEHIISLL